MQRYIKWFLAVLAALVVAGLIEGYLLGLLKQRDADVDRSTERTAKFVAESIARHLKDGTSIDRDVLNDIFRSQPQLGYIIIDDWMNGLRSGDVNQSVMESAPANVKQSTQSGDFDEIAGYLIQDGKGGASVGFEVLQVELRDELDPAAEPKAVIKMGYVVPGYVEMYRAITMAQVALLLFVCAFVVMALRSMRNRRAAPASFPVVVERDSTRPAREEIDLFETALPSEPTEIVSLSQRDDLEYEKWIDLLSENPTAQWEKRGLWYAMSDFVLANPWRASLVRQDLFFKDYVYRVKAKKLVGSDGFIILFTAGDLSLVWVLGGWNNTRSELAGYEKTRLTESVETNRWYDLTIEVLADVVRGYVNGDKKWELQRSELKTQDYTADFLPGLGVASWNTVAKFKDLFVLDRSDTTDAESEQTKADD